MSFKLEITIAGLCVLVPDTVREEMHVLMPNTRGGIRGCTHQHEARIYFDPKYLTGDSTAADAPPKDWHWDDIYHGSATLAGAGPGVPSVPKEVLSIGASVHPECLQSDGGDRLDGRITITNSTFECITPGSIWGLPCGPDQHLTFEATWKMTVNAASLKWNMTSLVDGTALQTTELHPVDVLAGKLLKVYIVHGIKKELPDVVTHPLPEPPLHARPEHLLECLGSVFPTATIPNVRYRRKEQRTATTFSCMLTSGDMP
jgi:hypothetical protein